MRPVDKGEWPEDSGIKIVFQEYGGARPYLIDRLGDFCSYCGNQITNPAVEHEQAKIVAPDLEKEWSNLLLACVICNSIKGHDLIMQDDYYWPDHHNTSLLFEYGEFGVVSLKNKPHPSVDNNKASKTLKLTGLDRFGSETASAADRRWIKRGEAFGKAKVSLNYYVNTNRPADYIPLIKNTALSTGFWSVWVKVFEGEKPVTDALTKAFKNTFKEYETTNIDRL